MSYLDDLVAEYGSDLAAAELAALRAQVEYVIRELGVGDNNRPVEALVRGIKAEQDELMEENANLRLQLAHYEVDAELEAGQE